MPFDFNKSFILNAYFSLKFGSIAQKKVCSIAKSKVSFKSKKLPKINCEFGKFGTLFSEDISYSVSLSGAVTLTVDGEPSYGFTDSEGDLFTVGDPASRMYGVKLGTGVTNANLANATFDLQGLAIESSNVTLNATDYVGAVATFNADGTALTLSGTISKAVSAFSDIALPLVISATETINLISNEITVADNGRLSPITFIGLGYLPQEASIFRKLTVADNIAAILETRTDLRRAERIQKRDELLEEFHISHIKNSLGMSLSGGERRRVEIARALASDPAFMLLDEPFAGVDPISVNDIKNVITQLKNRGIGVLITDHNVRETLDICERAYIVGRYINTSFF